MSEFLVSFYISREINSTVIIIIINSNLNLYKMIYLCLVLDAFHVKLSCYLKESMGKKWWLKNTLEKVVFNLIGEYHIIKG